MNGLIKKIQTKPHTLYVYGESLCTYSFLRHHRFLGYPNQQPLHWFELEKGEIVFECVLVDKAPFYFRLKKKIEPTVTTCLGRTMSQRSNNILHGRKSMPSLHYSRPFNIGIVVTGPQDSNDFFNVRILHLG